MISFHENELLLYILHRVPILLIRIANLMVVKTSNKSIYRLWVLPFISLHLRNITVIYNYICSISVLTGGVFYMTAYYLHYSKPLAMISFYFFLIFVFINVTNLGNVSIGNNNYNINDIDSVIFSHLKHRRT